MSKRRRKQKRVPAYIDWKDAGMVQYDSRVDQFRKAIEAYLDVNAPRHNMSTMREGTIFVPSCWQFDGPALRGIPPVYPVLHFY